MPSVMERKLGEILVKDKLITHKDLEAALKRQEEDGQSLGHILVEMHLASEWEIAAALGKQLNVPFITLSHYDIDPKVVESIPEDIVRKYRIVPVDKTGDSLTVALSDPSNIYLLDELRILTKCQIIPVISFESDIIEAIQKYYSKDDNHYEEMLKDITEQQMEIMKEEAESQDDEELAINADDAPVIQLVNLMISEAIKARSSDIHIEPLEKSLRLRYRIDGVLHEMTPPPKKFQKAIISRIKILAELDIAEKRLPQDGRFKVKVQNRPIDFRISVCPMAFGEKVVMRILDREQLLLNLTDLGFEPGALKLFEEQIRKPWGMVLVTGPTGSGKSTTLYCALHSINDPRKNILTIEDPIEYQLKGINQVQAKPEIGLTFAEGLRCFLRQDPDIILVGEVRDLETAEVAIKAALTGHLVMSTLHTNDAASSVTRMINMGVEPYLVTASVNLLIAQRLVRRVCENCKDVYKPSLELVQALGAAPDPSVKFYRGFGCERCHHTGYRGRLAIYEVLPLTDQIRDLILEGISSSQLKHIALQNGMQSLRQAGVKKVLDGVTTIEEVLSTTVADESLV